METKPQTRREAGMTLLRIGILCIAALFIVLGLSRGEAAIVLKKAVNLCLECIGLG